MNTLFAFAFAFAFLALTVPGFVLAVRTLPWVDAKVMAGVKPWACDVCACFWSTVLWSPIVAILFGLDALVAAPPSYAASLVVLGFLSRPGAPPSFPDPPGAALDAEDVRAATERIIERRGREP